MRKDCANGTFTVPVYNNRINGYSASKKEYVKYGNRYYRITANGKKNAI